jgi:hypothetical protein
LLRCWITIPCAARLILLIRQICPSDFWLFGYLKGVLQGNSFGEFDERLFAIQEILREADLEILEAVFQEWMI